MARVHERMGAVTILLVDSITELDAGDGGVFAVSGSHGGVNCAGYAMRAPLLGVAYNDAGVGKDGAGVAALAILDSHGVPGMTVSNMSAVIGEARDTLESGVISHVNAAAQAAGFKVGVALKEALRLQTRTG